MSRYEQRAKVVELKAITGRVPPCDLDAEAAVLSACLTSRDALDEVIDALAAESFYSQPHRLIFAAVLEASKAADVDVVAVAGLLRARGELDQAGGSAYLGQLVGDVPAAGQRLRAHAERVASLAAVRRALATLHEQVALGYDAGRAPDEWIDSVEAAVLAATDKQQRCAGPVRCVEVLQEIMQRLASDAPTEPALSTGLRSLDAMLGGGFRESEVWIVAGRPGMGKTQFGLGLCRAAESAGERTLFVSLEQPSQQITQRHLASLSGVSLSRVRAGAIRHSEWPAVTEAGRWIAERQLLIDDRSTISPAQLASVVRRVSAAERRAGRHLGLVVLDYLQLMSEPGHDKRELEVSSCSRQAKRLAKSSRVPVVLLAQLNRSVESRKDRRPMLSDLRESGSLEQDADGVLFLYREDYYDRVEGQPSESAVSDAEVIVAKQRNGPLGVAATRFWPACGRFEDGGAA